MQVDYPANLMNSLSNNTNNMEKELESIIKWLRQSGLKVNDSKTELCLFHRKDHLQIQIKIIDTTLTSKDRIGVLGIIFDSKLQWQYKVQNAINKSKKALNAIILIRGYFTKYQLLQIITSNYYSILYYNSEVWLLPTFQFNPESNKNYFLHQRLPSNTLLQIMKI